MVFLDNSMTDVYEAPKPVSKADGPYWSGADKYGKQYLAVDASGWRKEFRKQATVEAEVEKLQSLGYAVEITGGWRSNSRFIRLISEPVAEPAAVSLAPVYPEAEPVRCDLVEVLSWL